MESSEKRKPERILVNRSDCVSISGSGSAAPILVGWVNLGLSKYASLHPELPNIFV